jgi:RHS repeat-associated protein
MNQLEVGRKMQQIKGQYRYVLKQAVRVCLQNISDYSPFGAPLDGRTIQSDFYRYSFNGMEKDDEVKGNGNSYTTEFRQFDPRVGRWLSLDPLMAQFSSQAPYCAFDNNPIFYTDILGLESEGNGDKPKKRHKGTEDDPRELQEVRFTAKKTKKNWFERITHSFFKKEFSESTNPNIPDYNQLIEYQNINSTYYSTPPDEVKQTPLPEHIELSCKNYQNYGHYLNPFEQTSANIARYSVGEHVSNEDLFYSVFEIAPIGKLAKFVPKPKFVVSSAKGGSSVLLNTSRKLQAKFKHAGDFGVMGNYSKSNAGKFSSAINQHINSAGIQTINGTYRGQSVIHYLNPNTGLNVISSPTGQFISGWKLNPTQLQNVLQHGGL